MGASRTDFQLIQHAELVADMSVKEKTLIGCSALQITAQEQTRTSVPVITLSDILSVAIEHLWSVVHLYSLHRHG